MFLHERLNKIAETWKLQPNVALEEMIGISNKELLDHSGSNEIAIANARRINNAWNLTRQQWLKSGKTPFWVEDAYINWLKHKLPETGKFL